MFGADPDHVLAHVEHVVRCVGDDHVSLGSDFDGFTFALPRGLTDCTGLPLLTGAMLARGWPEARIRKILGLNAARVLCEVQAAAVS